MTANFANVAGLSDMPCTSLRYSLASLRRIRAGQCRGGANRWWRHLPSVTRKCEERRARYRNGLLASSDGHQIQTSGLSKPPQECSVFLQAPFDEPWSDISAQLLRPLLGNLGEYLPTKTIAKLGNADFDLAAVEGTDGISDVEDCIVVSAQLGDWPARRRRSSTGMLLSRALFPGG